MPDGSLKASLPELKARPGWRESEAGIRLMNSLSLTAVLVLAMMQCYLIFR